MLDRKGFVPPKPAIRGHNILALTKEGFALGQLRKTNGTSFNAAYDFEHSLETQEESSEEPVRKKCRKIEAKRKERANEEAHL